MPENEIAIFEGLKEPMAIGEVFAKSGMFPDVKTQAQAVVKILAGRELGLSAFQAMSSIYIVGGRLALVSNAMAGLVNKSKQYKYVIKELKNDSCTISFFKEDVLLGESTFTFKDAAAAGLANKDNYKNWPKNMMFARALTNGVRWYCPEVSQGYYTVEELEDLGGGIATKEPAKTEVKVEIQEAEVVSDGKKGA